MTASRLDSGRSTKIGVVSDTHGYFDLQLEKAFAGVDAILHGGDVGTEEVLDRLRAMAPLYAVRGNVDSAELSLPLSLSLSFGRLQLEMIHIPPVPQSELEAWATAAVPLGKPPHRSERLLQMLKAHTGAVIFGHSHVPCLANLGNVLFFNPGSAGKKRFSLPRTYGLLEVFPESIGATIKPLERYNGKLPEKIWLDLEESEDALSEENQTDPGDFGDRRRGGHSGD